LSQALLSEILNSIPPHTPHTVVPGKLRVVFDAFDTKLLSDFTGNFRHTLKVPIESIRQNFIAKKLCEDDIRSSVERVMSGSTALVAYVEESRLYLANTGDCRAGKAVPTSTVIIHLIYQIIVLGRLDNNGIISAQQMTEDLNAKNPHERSRLDTKNEEFALVGDRVLGQIICII
jgi:serine/threonine protein phosphatase PrpC